MACYLAGRVSQLARLSSQTDSSVALDAYDAQDAVSCMYHILQQYGAFLSSQDTHNSLAAPTAIVSIGLAALAALQVSQSNCCTSKPGDPDCAWAACQACKRLRCLLR